MVSRSAPAFASSFLLLTLYKSAAALSILLRVLTAASAFWSLLVVLALPRSLLRFFLRQPKIQDLS